MLLSAVSVLDVAQSSSEIPEGLMNNPVHGKHKYEHIRHARLQFFIIRRRLRNQKLFACVIFNSQLGSQDFEQIYQMVSVVFPLVMAVQNTTKDNCA